MSQTTSRFHLLASTRLLCRFALLSLLLGVSLELANARAPLLLDREIWREALLPGESSDPPGGTWTELTTPPLPRYGQTAIYDPIRDRMIIFGGTGEGDETWSLSLSDPPRWTHLKPQGPLPAARLLHTAIYDPVRDQMVIFGGYSADFTYKHFNDVWALSLGGDPLWTNLSPSGTPPAVRVKHSAIFDPVRDAMIVYGGVNLQGVTNDVWALSFSGQTSWSQLIPSGSARPYPRAEHGAVFDSIRDRMVIYGGDHYDDGTEVWSLSLGGLVLWSKLTPPSPWPTYRDRMSSIYDRARDRLVVFGGRTYYAGRPSVNDAWALSFSDTTWENLTPSGTLPLGRWNHSTAYDTARNRLLVFGGQGPTWDRETWALRLRINNLYSTIRVVARSCSSILHENRVA